MWERIAEMWHPVAAGSTTVSWTKPATASEFWLLGEGKSTLLKEKGCAGCITQDQMRASLQNGMRLNNNLIWLFGFISVGSSNWK